MKKLHFLLLGICLSCLLACQQAEPSTAATASSSSSPEKKTLSVSQNEGRNDAPTPDPKAGRRTAEEMVAAGFKRYTAEEAVIVFRLEGSVTGTETLFFNNWGWYEAKYEKHQTKAGSLIQNTDKVQYLNGECRIEYDPASNTGKFFESPQVQQAAEKHGTKDMTKVGEHMMTQMGGIKTGTEAILNMPCDIWWLPRYNTKLWMWNGVTMKEESTMANLPIKRTAVSIRTGVKMPVEKMVPPKGAKITGL